MSGDVSVDEGGEAPCLTRLLDQQAAISLEIASRPPLA